MNNTFYASTQDARAQLRMHTARNLLHTVAAIETTNRLSYMRIQLAFYLYGLRTLAQVSS